MKKTLVALAALASVSAFAQTTVTLSGNLDVAGATSSGTQNGAKGTTFTTGLGTASTSVINLIAVEDLGGGTKVTAKYGLDPRTLVNDGLSSTNMNAAGTANNTGATTNPNTVTVTGLARDEAYVGIESGFGSIKLGAPNSIGLDAHLASTPLGTGIGSGYGADDKFGSKTTMYTRYNRSIRFDSQVVNGLKGSALYAPGNDEAAVSYDGTAYVARNMPNNRKVTELGLSYANGPLNVQWQNLQIAAQTNPTGYYAMAASTNAALTATYGYVATKSNTLGVNYNLGATTLYAMWQNGDSTASSTSVTHVNGNRYAVKQNMGQVDLMFSYSQTVSGSTTTTTAKVIGGRADYNLSKTAAVYLGYENWDTGKAASSTTPNDTTSGTRKVTSIGLKKQF